jgi:hypothetical protein
MTPRRTPRLSLSTRALIELREADRQAGVDPAAFVRPIQLRPTPPPPDEPLHIPPADWDAEERDRQALEHRERTRIVERELAKLRLESEQ